jgi:TrmH RNA methyltransferase
MKTDTICGLKPVDALFRRREAAVERLFYVSELRAAAGPWCAILAAARKPYRMVEPEELEKIAGTPHHGGMVAIARVASIPVFNIQQPPKVKLLLVLDGIGNPHNLGAIARSAAFFGVGAMLIGEGEGHAMPSDAAYRVSEGGLEMLDLFKSRNLVNVLSGIDGHYRTVAASLSRESASLEELPRDRPIALVLGNEERGVSPEVLAVCRRQVKIMGSGRIQSLNVAQAAAVLLADLSKG